MSAVTEQPVHPLRLRVSRKEAAAQLQNQVKIGRAIKGQRLRDRWDLDQARAEKQEWVRRCTETLEAAFNQGAMAEQFNEWTAPILPEYAEFDMFVELFVDEMRHRLERLEAALLAVDTIPEPGIITSPPSSADEGASKEHPMKTETAPVLPTPAPPPAATAAAARPQASAMRGLLVAYSSNATITDAVTRFLGQLGIELVAIERAALQAPLTEELTRCGASFAVMLSAEQSPSDAATGAERQYLFDLGCCVGRLGHGRVCIVRPTDGQQASDAHGVQHICIDATDGWQLPLARHLRRGGVNLDLNKLL